MMISFRACQMWGDNLNSLATLENCRAANRNQLVVYSVINLLNRDLLRRNKAFFLGDLKVRLAIHLLSMALKPRTRWKFFCAVKMKPVRHVFLVFHPLNIWIAQGKIRKWRTMERHCLWSQFAKSHLTAWKSVGNVFGLRSRISDFRCSDRHLF